MLFRSLHELCYGREHLVPDTLFVSSVSPMSTDSIGCLSLHISVGPFSMPHIFHVMDVSHMSWHMLLGRPWIHDHRCVPSSWHQCIKAAPFKTGQIRVRGLKNPFAIEEAYFYEAAYFIEQNVLTLARKSKYLPYPAIIDLPSHVKPTANYPPRLPPKKIKISTFICIICP